MDGQTMTTGQRLEAAFGNLPEGGIMTGKSKFCGASWTSALCAIGFLMGSLMESVVLAAQDEKTTRRLWDTAFIKPKKKASTNRQYRPVTPSIPPVRVPEDTVIGITVWRLRPSKPSDQGARFAPSRSEEHTSELQSPCNLVCRLLLEKKKNKKNQKIYFTIILGIHYKITK